MADGAASPGSIMLTSVILSLPHDYIEISTIPDPLAPYDRKYRPANSVCSICNKVLSNQYNLRVHMDTHAGRRHACRACGHVSRSRDALRKHVAYRHARHAADVWHARTDTSVMWRNVTRTFSASRIWLLTYKWV